MTSNNAISQSAVFNLNEDTLIHICKFLNNEDVLSLMTSNFSFATIFSTSSFLQGKFRLDINKSTYQKHAKNVLIWKIPFMKIIVNFDAIKLNQIVPLFWNFKEHAQFLEVKALVMKNFEECFEFFSNMRNLRNLLMQECKLDNLNGKALPSIETLQVVSFDKCDANVMKIFRNQFSLEKIIVHNDDYTWNGFDHETFNDLAKNLPKIRCIVMIGPGTGSYFDCDKFPYLIEVLDATMITFHWYVGIKTARTRFLKTQLGSLKELTIHQLPFDFDGGKVLKFIIEEMKLQKFNYGNISLILNGQKQNVEEFEASETQIQSSLEMFRQFQTIKRFRLNILPTDIASDEIENVINPRTFLFWNLQEFTVNDNSKYYGTFGVFLGLYKNLKFIKKLSFITMNRNINVILQECLQDMIKLEEIQISTTNVKIKDLFAIIKRCVPKLRKLSIAKQYLEDAKDYFGNTVEIHDISSIS